VTVSIFPDRHGFLIANVVGASSRVNEPHRRTGASEAESKPTPIEPPGAVAASVGGHAPA